MKQFFLENLPRRNTGNGVYYCISHPFKRRNWITWIGGSRRAEQLTFRSQQRIVATVEDSVLRTEMVGLESLEEDAPKRILFYTPMGWLGQIRSHRRDETWSTSI